ncbi:hypothetical protein I3760_12G001900 [Carya illinoinensis]|uniref:Uncharacterized protein n=1 Tax=Carya illinoinensis TaxID=32201 RepID=A0A922DF71_CARIL|nr:hypothetical protein I3760_12G001900 [Carya illinoinensis]KAG6683239.1 hypothetical protein I3842_12G001900 [Carya illinoinensis]
MGKCCSHSDADEVLVGLVLAWFLAMAFFLICQPPPPRRVTLYHC